MWVHDTRRVDKGHGVAWVKPCTSAMRLVKKILENNVDFNHTTTQTSLIPVNSLNLHPARFAMISSYNTDDVILGLHWIALICLLFYHPH